MEKLAVKVERETFEMDGKTYFGYFIKGNGGYTVLDIVFDGAMAADLEVTPFEMKTEDGKVIAGNTYAVTSLDPETGEVYSCKVKPARESDKTLLQMLLR